MRRNPEYQLQESSSSGIYRVLVRWESKWFWQRQWRMTEWKELHAQNGSGAFLMWPIRLDKDKADELIKHLQQQQKCTESLVV